ncbi:hypothetical protein [Sulfuricurvum sp.]|uniref:hypothetical protein n=1 Tax=Sulfuricurvum sp. TaxID=2025608 RepID=UPI002E35B5BC|nr:hypothetical protein [Sulfuricurvum sp.]HEX5329608.1 hypothetical protein [Sulfuricurvum sp.]
MFSFLTRFFQKNIPLEEIQPESTNRLPIDTIHSIAQEEDGLFFENFNLFYQDKRLKIDLLLFLPYRGLYFAEAISWDFTALQDMSIERSSQKSKKRASTHLEETASAIHQKLEDILSFDSTVCERFFWMNRLNEDEFDRLDPSFHALLPKERLIFNDSSKESIRYKLDSLAQKRDEPYSTLKIMGSLQSHTLILPSEENPYGQFLSEEQLTFLETDFTDTVTTLFGEHNSGKSSAIIRKALLTLLSNPKENVLIITPTLIGGEILRHELISLLEYGALSIDFNCLHFYTPRDTETLTQMDIFQSASSILCDDSHLLEKGFIDALLEHREKRWILLSMHNNYTPISNSSIIFYNHYQKNIHYRKLPANTTNVLMTLLLELRGQLLSSSPERVMVILESDKQLMLYKEGIDEYFDIKSRILSKEFSLQYQNLDNLILTTPEYTYGLHVAHVYFIVSDEIDNYTYALSRASESATIISVSKPEEVEDDLISISSAQES